VAVVPVLAAVASGLDTTEKEAPELMGIIPLTPVRADPDGQSVEDRMGSEILCRATLSAAARVEVTRREKEGSPYSKSTSKANASNQDQEGEDGSPRIIFEEDVGAEPHFGSLKKAIDANDLAAVKS